eukprot:g10133.t1
MPWSLSRAAIYRSGRTEAAFSDGSGVVLHPSTASAVASVSFFEKNGQRQRLLSTCLPQTAQIRAKVHAAAALQRRFAVRGAARICADLRAPGADLRSVGSVEQRRSAGGSYVVEWWQPNLGKHIPEEPVNVTVTPCSEFGENAHGVLCEHVRQVQCFSIEEPVQLAWLYPAFLVLTKHCANARELAQSQLGQRRAKAKSMSEAPGPVTKVFALIDEALGWLHHNANSAASGDERLPPGDMALHPEMGWQPEKEIVEGTARLTIFRSGPRRLVRLLSKTARLSFHVEAPVGGASFDHDPVDAALLALGREMRVRVVSMDGSQEEELKMVRTILAKHAKAVKLKVGQRLALAEPMRDLTNVASKSLVLQTPHRTFSFIMSDQSQRDTCGYCILYLLKIKNRGVMAASSSPAVKASQGPKSGTGKVTYPNRSTYEGQFNNSMRHGQGVLTLSDGTRYVAQWKNDERHGEGKEFCPDGTTFEGHYVAGMRHGYGVMKWPEGSKYSGMFERGRANGQGELLRTDGSVYKGQFCEDCMSGEGRMRWRDGVEYIGQFVANKREGYGTMTWMSGRWKKYSGQWKDGMQNEIGVLVDHNDQDMWRWFWETIYWRPRPETGGPPFDAPRFRDLSRAEFTELIEDGKVFVVPEISKTWILKDWDCAMACHGRHRARTGH